MGRGGIRMKQIYRCEIDGKIFENRGECLKYEFELKGGNRLFKEEVNAAIKHLEENTDLTFVILDANAEVEWDGDPNKEVYTFVEWQNVNIEVYHNDKKRGEDFYRSSEGGFNKDSIVKSILEEYVQPYQNKFEGFLTDNDDCYSSGFDLNGINLDAILRGMYGKKIRIEVIE
jgi:hypothetical protein